MTGLLTLICTGAIVYVFRNTIKRIHSILGYITFYGFSIFYITILLLYSFRDYLIILNSFWLTGQIIHNIKKGLRPGFNIYYIGLILGGNLYLFYLKGYPNNILFQSPNI